MPIVDIFTLLFLGIFAFFAQRHLILQIRALLRMPAMRDIGMGGAWNVIFQNLKIKRYTPFVNMANTAKSSRRRGKKQNLPI